VSSRRSPPWLLASLAATVACQAPAARTDPIDLSVRLENVGTPQTASCGAYDPLVAPGIYAVAPMGTPLFSTGVPDPGRGLAPLAEDGDPSVLHTSVAQDEDVFEVNVFDTPDGTYESGAIQPGEAFSFTLRARPGDRLFLAGMYVQSNDLFVATPPEGLALFDGDDPITGVRDGALALYDAGTEVNEEPGCGPNQAPRQAAPGEGAVESAPVDLVEARQDGFPYPAASSILQLSIDAANP